MLLGVVADLEPVPRHDLAGVRGVDAGEDPQQRGLAGAVEAEDDDPGALVDGQVDVGEHLERAVGLRQLGGGERRLAARRRRRELDPRDLVRLALALEARHQPLGALEHRLRGLRLGGLGAHPVRLVGQRLGLVLGVHPLALAALLVGLALQEVGPPAHVVDVDLGPVGVQVQDLVDGPLQQRGVVADHDQAAPVRRQEVAQPDDRVRVEVVGRLVEQQRLGAGEQDPGQLDPAPLPAGQGARAAGRGSGPRCRGWTRSGRPRPRRRTRLRRAARRRPARSGASPGPGPPGRRCPSRSRPRAGGVRRRRGRARTGSVRGRARSGRPCAGPGAGSRRCRWCAPCPQQAAPRRRGSW